MKLVSGKKPPEQIKVEESKPVLKYNWQHMDYAPRDGTFFLATGLNGGINKRGRHYVRARYDRYRGKFIEEVDGLCHNLDNLTHWTYLISPEEECMMESNEKPRYLRHDNIADKI